MKPNRPTREYDIIDQVIEEPPSVLWHYTDASGFLGIITGGGLRLGKSNFLNDQTERDYGWGVVNDVLADQVSGHDHVSQFFRFVKQVTDPVQFDGDTFLVSLSARSESISQWQRYGADGHGYCLGIGIRDLLADPEFAHVLLRPLAYSREVQRTAVEDVIGTFRRQLEAENPLLENGTAMRWMRALIMLQLAELVLTFKNPSFADEEEWRLVLLINATEDPMRQRIEFSRRGDVIKPHVDLFGGHPAAPRVPVREVICGPRLDAELAKSSVEFFLRERGLHGVSVKPSRLAGTWR